MTDVPSILVLRRGTHGLPANDYAAELRARLPDVDVALARTPHEERSMVADATIVTGLYFDEELLNAAEHLRLFASAAAGYGHLPLDEFEERGVAVTTASGVHAPNIAEQVVGHILMLTHRLDEGLRRQQNGEWRHFRAYELQGSTVTVVGLGAIGTAVVDRLRGFGVETIGVRYSPEKGGPTDEVIGFDPESFHDALARTDHLVLACPLTETTTGLIGEAEFATLEPHAVLVNIARGGVVNTDALVSALRSNSIRGAALDVTDPEPLPHDHPLWKLENALITPHNSGHTPAYWPRLADIVAENVDRIRTTGEYVDLRNQIVTPK